MMKVSKRLEVEDLPAHQSAEEFGLSNVPESSILLVDGMRKQASALGKTSKTKPAKNCW